MPIISTKELDIYYERSEPRENGPILYIGGTGGDLRNKPNQLDCPLAEHFEIISYDQRGLGQTSKPPGPYTMQQYADDAANFLNELEIDSILVMGVSFGGMVAQELIKRHTFCLNLNVFSCFFFNRGVCLSGCKDRKWTDSAILFNYNRSVICLKGRWNRLSCHQVLLPLPIA
mgnify:CR=1 FL=1